MRLVPRDSDALLPVLDMERNHRCKICRRRLNAAQVWCAAQRFINVIERCSGKKLVLSTTVYFWKETEIGRLPIAQFWPRSVAGRAFGAACLAQRF
jgi:lysozyme